PSAAPFPAPVADEYPQPYATPASGRVESVAMNYDAPAPSAPNAVPASSPTDADPYAGIVYEPQQTSRGGFAPGSAAIY
ncbi:MAG: hypothetical protein IJM30_09595, partial [Thermoguttaceae bacterium]|nr:hypothetical protein [Thermoguttaceae bacterium]